MKPRLIILTASIIFGSSFFYFLGRSEGPGPKITKILQDDGLSLEDFDKRVNNKTKIVLVYFSADWCIPCVKLKPIIEQITKEQIKTVDVLELDADKNPKIATHFEINTLPLFVIYKQGKKVWEYNAFISKEDLTSKLDLYSGK